MREFHIELKLNDLYKVRNFRKVQIDLVVLLDVACPGLNKMLPDSLKTYSKVSDIYNPICLAVPVVSTIDNLVWK